MGYNVMVSIQHFDCCSLGSSPNSPTFLICCPLRKEYKDEWHYLNYRKYNRTLQHRGTQPQITRWRNGRRYGARECTDV